MKCAISADLSRFPACPHKTPRARATVYAKGAGNRTLQKIPAGKRGFFHAGNHKTPPEAACCRRVGLPGGGTPGPAAGRGTFYDVTFIADGVEIEVPDEAVVINMEFKNVASEENETQSALHIQETEAGVVAQDVTAQSADGTLKSVGFNF